MMTLGRRDDWGEEMNQEEADQDVVQAFGPILFEVITETGYINYLLTYLLTYFV